MKPLKQWTKQDLIDLLKHVDKRTWLMIAAAVVGLSALWFVLIGPAWIKRPYLRREIQNMDTQLRQYQILNQKRIKLEEDRKTYQALFEETKVRLYEEGDIALLLGQVSKLAHDAKVDMIASRPQKDSVLYPKPYQDRYLAVGYDFTMQGGYHQLARLAAAIESYPKLLRIQKIQIVPSKDDQSRHVAQFDLVAIAGKAAAGQGNAKI
ncbi:MAG: Pilus assembly protein, PilO [Candidatus Omnitrophica bacterium ADurb.Bin277]|nr:MAG: Pilus assembly protein, PilO [Candidatus Omnitrophica bacterium ADurb.Bin277]